MTGLTARSSDTTKGVGSFWQQGGGHGSRNPLRRHWKNAQKLCNCHRGKRGMAKHKKGIKKACFEHLLLRWLGLKCWHWFSQLSFCCCFWFSHWFWCWPGGVLSGFEFWCCSTSCCEKCSAAAGAAEPDFVARMKKKKVFVRHQIRPHV